MKTRFLVSALAAMSFQVAEAGFFTAEDLYKWYGLQGPTEARTEIYYQVYGYVLGVYDQSDEALWCSPVGTKAAQVMKVAENYLSAHPEGWQNGAASEIGKGFAAAWPCPWTKYKNE